MSKAIRGNWQSTWNSYISYELGGLWGSVVKLVNRGFHSGILGIGEVAKEVNLKRRFKFIKLSDTA